MLLNYKVGKLRNIDLLKYSALYKNVIKIMVIEKNQTSFLNLNEELLILHNLSVDAILVGLIIKNRLCK